MYESCSIVKPQEPGFDPSCHPLYLEAWDDVGIPVALFRCFESTGFN